MEVIEVVLVGSVRSGAGWNYEKLRWREEVELRLRGHLSDVSFSCTLTQANI